MAHSDGPPSLPGEPGRSWGRKARVLIVTSVMFTFISYWRTAAVVLCDLASTAYYIGGIVEQAIGPAAPWFILAVMIFSYFVRMVYIESCTMFVRGGVYRVVREALGGFVAKLAVSALMFDYILTGPISGVSAGQYIIGLLIESVKLVLPETYGQLNLGEEKTRELLMRGGSVIIALGITVFFYWQNIKGIHESSGRALQIMVITTVMAAIMISWCLLTLAIRGPANSVFRPPDLSRKVVYEVGQGIDRSSGEEKEMWQRDPGTGRLVPKVDEQGQAVPKMNDLTKKQEDPLGFLGWLPDSWTQPLRQPASWFSLIGFFGIAIAFGHSILAMSGEETLAQVYREVESPKLPNFKKAAFIVFVYSILLTGGISFLAVLIIPDEVRMKDYADNLIGGLAMHLWGWPLARLILNAFVVVVGFLILAGAVNTSIIGSNGVLNRVAEDGVMPDWFLKPHRHYGTTHRILTLIFGLQVVTILVTAGNVLLLGEAYAFGVIWSFVFQALSMVMLRFQDRRPREYKVPLNIRVGDVEVPIGLSLILLVLFITAVMNLLTKEVATISGVIFTAVFFTIFLISERYYERKRRGGRHEHLEQFNQETTNEINPRELGLEKPYRKLVAIRSPQNLFMLEKALTETDPETTGVVVMTAKLMPTGMALPEHLELDTYDQQLMTAVVTRAERAGKQVKPLIVPTNNPLHAVLKTAKDLQVNELILGASNKYTADEQMEQIAFIWISLHGGEPTPLTVRILNRERDMYLDLAGGNRIPKISERKARTVAELRAAGVGVDRVLLLHDGTSASSDLFQAVLTMLDPEVALGLLLPPELSEPKPPNGQSMIEKDRERAEKLAREVHVLVPKDASGAEIVRLAREEQYDLIILGLPPDRPAGAVSLVDERSDYVLRRAHCRVFLTAPPEIPSEVVDTHPSGEMHR